MVRSKALSGNEVVPIRLFLKQSGPAAALLRNAPKSPVPTARKTQDAPPPLSGHGHVLPSPLLSLGPRTVSPLPSPGPRGAGARGQRPPLSALRALPTRQSRPGSAEPRAVSVIAGAKRPSAPILFAKGALDVPVPSS